jgi:Zn-dependent peptidase ImmA (M78 family)
VTPADPVQLASSLRKEAALHGRPVDVFTFINQREDVVMIRRFGQGANIDGIYVKDDQNGIGFIYLNRAKPLGRQRFTAAHELGHHLLHHGEELDADVFSANQSDEEKAANRFAAEFLIPRAGLLKFISSEALDVSRLPDAIAVAKHFRVSLQPVLIQLRRFDRLSGPDFGRLVREAENLKPNPLSEWENVSASGATDFPPRFVDLVRRRYLAGEITPEAAAEALDVPLEAISDRFGARHAAFTESDLSDLL